MSTAADSAKGWSWEVHVVSQAYRVSPETVRRTYSLWELTEAAAHITIAQLMESV